MNDPQIDDPRVVRALESSVLLGAVSGVMHRLWHAAAHSRVAGRMAGARAEWERHRRAERRLAFGLMLLVAAATHVVLVITHGIPAGWLWIVPPGMAASLGLLYAWTSEAPRATE